MLSDYKIQKQGRVYFVTDHNYSRLSTLFSYPQQGLWDNQNRREKELLSFMPKALFPFLHKHNVIVRWTKIEKEIDQYYIELSELYCYKSSGIEDDRIPLEDISLTICCEEKPHRLIDYLRKKHYQVVTPLPGLYCLSKEENVDVQIAVINSVQEPENAWWGFFTRPVKVAMPCATM